MSVSISGKELRSNRGTSRISNLQQEKTRQAQFTLEDNIATDLYSDGTATSSKQIDGLTAVIATTTTSGTYASINTANNAAWRNQVATSVGSTVVNGLSNLRNIANSCSQGAGAPSHPDFYITTQTVHEAFEGLLQPAVRYSVTTSRNAEASVNPVFRGAEIMWDSHCTSGVLYVLNSNHLFFFIHRDANFAMAEGGFQKPINQDALVTQILLQGNLATDNRRKLGKLTGLT